MSAATFAEHRPYLQRLAYRMLGSLADAEDAVQETFLRWHASGEPVLESPRAWFARTCTRICLDTLKSAQRKRLSYVGDWLPEPFLDEAADKERIDDSLSIALLLSIQRLRPTERAVFLLHDVFGHPFEEVAEILELEPANCRQIAARARRFLEAPRVRAQPAPADVSRLAEAFFGALASGDVGALSSMLAADVVLRGDGGGKAGANPRPLVGAADVVRFLDLVFVSSAPRPVFERAIVWFNGSPGVLCTVNGKPISAFHFEVDGDRIVGIFVHRNPDKLAAFGALH